MDDPTHPPDITNAAKRDLVPRILNARRAGARLAFSFATVSGQPPALGCSENGNRVVFPYRGWVTNMNVKDLIEVLRELPKGSMVVLQRNEFEALFRDSDPRRRAENIARLNGCDLTLDEKSGVARFTRVEKA
jgi:hypothetical protein